MRDGVAEIGHAPPHDEAAERPGRKRHRGTGEKGADQKIVEQGGRLPCVLARNRIFVEALHIFLWSMILSDLASPAEAGFAKAGNRSPLFGIML